MLFHNAYLHNIVELVPAAPEAGFGILRIPQSVRQHLNDLARNNSVQGSGCEVRFNLVGPSATLTLQAVERPVIAEVYSGCFLHSWQVIQTTPTTITIAPHERHAKLLELSKLQRFPFDTQLFRVMLPWRPPCRILNLQGDLTPPRPEQTPALRYLAYGSSITHGNCTFEPTGTWASQLARLLNADLINLGFGGGAHCEKEIVDYIAGREDWSFATLEMGINMLGGFTVEEHAARVEYLISTLHRKYPEKYLFCIDVFTHGEDWLGNGEGKTAAFRRNVAEIVRKINSPKVLHIDGRAMLPSPTGLTADLVHPSPDGMTQIATNLHAILRHYVQG